VIAARDALASTGVDQLLVAPVVDRLPGDAEIRSDLSDASARVEQVEDLPSELGWIGLGRVSPSGSDTKMQGQPTPPNPGHITRESSDQSTMTR